MRAMHRIACRMLHAAALCVALRLFFFSHVLVDARVVRRQVGSPSGTRRVTFVAIPPIRADIKFFPPLAPLPAISGTTSATILPEATLSPETGTKPAPVSPPTSKTSFPSLSTPLADSPTFLPSRPTQSVDSPTSLASVFTSNVASITFFPKLSTPTVQSNTLLPPLSTPVVVSTSPRLTRSIPPAIPVTSSLSTTAVPPLPTRTSIPPFMSAPVSAASSTQSSSNRDTAPPLPPVVSNPPVAGPTTQIPSRSTTRVQPVILSSSGTVASTPTHTSNHDTTPPILPGPSPTVPGAGSPTPAASAIVIPAGVPPSAVTAAPTPEHTSNHGSGSSDDNAGKSDHGSDHSSDHTSDSSGSQNSDSASASGGNGTEGANSTSSSKTVVLTMRQALDMVKDDVHPGIIAAPIFLGLYIIGLAVSLLTSFYQSHYPNELWNKTLGATGADSGACYSPSVPRPGEEGKRKSEIPFYTSAITRPITRKKAADQSLIAGPWQKHAPRASVLVAALSPSGLYVADNGSSLSLAQKKAVSPDAPRHALPKQVAEHQKANFSHSREGETSQQLERPQYGHPDQETQHFDSVPAFLPETSGGPAFVLSGQAHTFAFGHPQQEPPPPQSPTRLAVPPPTQMQSYLARPEPPYQKPSSPKPSPPNDPSLDTLAEALAGLASPFQHNVPVDHTIAVSDHPGFANQSPHPPTISRSSARSPSGQSALQTLERIYGNYDRPWSREETQRQNSAGSSQK